MESEERMHAQKEQGAPCGRMRRAAYRHEELSVIAFVPEHASPDTVLYLHADEETAQALCSAASAANAALVAIDGEAWNRDLSPWAAERVFKKGEPFSGGADAYLQRLLRDVIAPFEASLAVAPSRRMLAGYSLAGLFAVYASYRTDAFCAFASVSGSLWFDGFDAFMQKNTPLRIPEKAYFSLGDLEKRTRNPRMAQVEACTAQAAARFEALGAQVRFELNPGNHFACVTERMQKAVAFLLARP